MMMGTAGVRNALKNNHQDDTKKKQSCQDQVTNKSKDEEMTP